MYNLVGKQAHCICNYSETVIRFMLEGGTAVLERTVYGHLTWSGKGEIRVGETDGRFPRGILLELKLGNQ